MTKKRVVIVGGVAGGTYAASLRRLDVSFANCDLPYYVGGRPEI
jgi:NADPH-dependent 2,4-dienoyl-CoA reductase/sulfur reductase-like enzyme